jgi:molybdate transport system substrate-binding protein
MRKTILFRGLRLYCIAILLAAASGFYACTQEADKKVKTGNQNLYIRADAILKPTLLEVAQDYHFLTSTTIHFNFSTSSHVLTHGSADSVDAFIFLNDHYVAIAREMDVADSSEAVTLAYAVPSMILSRTNPSLISTLADLTLNPLRFGIADSRTDLLGHFSIELLKKNLIYDKINHLVQTGPTALDLAELVAKGELDAAICWSMAYNWNPESFDVVLLMPNEIPRVAVISSIRSAKPVDPITADRFMNYLKTDRCRFIFRKWGFLINDSDVDMYAPAAEIGGEPQF